jgi:hypothetical protein
LIPIIADMKIFKRLPSHSGKNAAIGGKSVTPINLPSGGLQWNTIITVARQDCGIRSADSKQSPLSISSEDKQTKVFKDRQIYMPACERRKPAILILDFEINKSLDQDQRESISKGKILGLRSQDMMVFTFTATKMILNL